MLLFVYGLTGTSVLQDIWFFLPIHMSVCLSIRLSVSVYLSVCLPSYPSPYRKAILSLGCVLFRWHMWLQRLCKPHQLWGVPSEFSLDQMYVVRVSTKVFIIFGLCSNIPLWTVLRVEGIMSKWVFIFS